MPVWGTGGRWFESSHPDTTASRSNSKRVAFFVSYPPKRHALPSPPHVSVSSITLEKPLLYSPKQPSEQDTSRRTQHHEYQAHKKSIHLRMQKVTFGILKRHLSLPERYAFKMPLRIMRTREYFIWENLCAENAFPNTNHEHPKTPFHALRRLTKKTQFGQKQQKH